MSERIPPGRRSDYRAFQTITTRWMDNDTYGHVNNAVYSSFIDTSVSAYLVSSGFLKPTEAKVIGLAVETACRYFAPISFPDVVTGGIRVARKGTSSVRYEVGIFRNDEDTASAEGHFIHVYVDRTTNRPVPLPPELVAVLEPLLV